MKRALLPLLLLVSVALAVSYRVDPGGGPDSLGTEVAAAFDAWLELDDALSAEVSEEAATRFAYAQPDLLGPDTVSLSLRRENPDRVAVLLSPSASERSSALLHEAGLLLGLGVRSEGVMNPALGETPLSLGEEAGALLEELGALDEDLNFDGVVDFYDLVELAKGFGQRGVGLSADINEDGVVDEADAERLRAVYTFTPPSATPPGEEDELVTEDDTFGENEEEGEEPLDEEDPEADPSEPVEDSDADGQETNPGEAPDTAQPADPEDATDSGSPEDGDNGGEDTTGTPEDPNESPADPPANDP